MFESRNRPFAPALAATLAGIALAGCHASSDGPEAPPPPTEVAKANFNITTGQLPYPTDLFFAPSAAVPLADGTLNLPSIAYRPASMQGALNALDGWSTSATLDTSFSLPLDAASISATSVKIVKLWLNPSTKAPVNPADPAQAGFLPVGATSPVAGIMTYGTDFAADVSDDVDSVGKILRITPLKPWEASRGPAVNSSGPNAGRVFNVGYLVILTNGLKATGGAAMTPDTFYSDIKAAPADCSTFTNATQKAVCQLTKAHLGIAQATGTNPADIVMSWSFSTQATTDTMNAVTAIAGATNAALPNRTLIVPAFNTTLGRILTTKDANAGLAGQGQHLPRVDGVAVLPDAGRQHDGPRFRADQVLDRGRGTARTADGYRQPQPHDVQPGAGESRRRHRAAAGHGARTPLRPARASPPAAGRW